MRYIRFVILGMCLINSVFGFSQDSSFYLRSDLSGQGVLLKESFQTKLEAIKLKSINEVSDVRFAAIKNNAMITMFEMSQLQNGFTLFNKELMEYCQSLVNTIIQKNSNVLTDKIKVYISRSTSVNAFATDNGNIWITLGLLTRCNTESELAFVLCHELSHVVKQHSYSTTITTAQDAFNETEDFLSVHKYSQANELQADSLGLSLYLNTEYSLKAIPRVYDILATSILPLVEYNKELSYPFSGKVADRDTGQVPFWSQMAIEKRDVEESSHPNIYSRRKVMTTYLGDRDTTDPSGDFIISSEKTFLNLKRKAIYTMSDLFLENYDYVNAISFNQYLLTQFENDPFVKYNLMMAWVASIDKSFKRKSKYDKDFLFKTNFLIHNVSKGAASKQEIANILESAFLLYKTDTTNVLYRHAAMMAHSAGIYKNIGSKKERFGAPLSLLDPEIKTFYSQSFDVLSLYRSSTAEIKGNLATDGILILNPRAISIDFSDQLPIDVYSAMNQTDYLSHSIDQIGKNIGANIQVVSSVNSAFDVKYLSDYLYTLNQFVTKFELTSDGSKTVSSYDQFNLYISPLKWQEFRSINESKYLLHLIQLERDPGKNKLLNFFGKLYFSIFIPGTIPQIFYGTFQNRYDLTYFAKVLDLDHLEYVREKTFYVKKSIGSDQNRKIYLQSFLKDVVEN